MDLTEGQKGEISNKIDAILDNQNILASILSDSDMPGVPTKDLDPDDPASKAILKDRILNHIYAEQGSLVAPDKPGTNNLTSTQRDDAAQRARLTKAWNAGTDSFSIVKKGVGTYDLKRVVNGDGEIVGYEVFDPSQAGMAVGAVGNASENLTFNTLDEALAWAGL